jgi:methionyl-tRNA formyltransferase
MTVVLLTRLGAEHKFVANALHRDLDVSAVIVADPPRPGPAVRARQVRRRYTPAQLAGRVGTRLLRMTLRDKRRRSVALEQVLGRDSTDFLHPERVERVPTHRSPETLRLLEQLRPDLLLVYGTAIIPDEVLERATIGALNMHTGLSPEYRGSDCAFWPVHNRDFDLIGATVHECTSAVDGGAILARRKASLVPTDGLHEVFARCVLAGAAIYGMCAAGVLENGVIGGTPQDVHCGCEFRASMRTFRAEYRTRRIIAAGELRCHVLASTVEPG